MKDIQKIYERIALKKNLEGENYEKIQLIPTRMEILLKKERTENVTGTSTNAEYESKNNETATYIEKSTTCAVIETSTKEMMRHLDTPITTRPSSCVFSRESHLTPISENQSESTATPGKNGSGEQEASNFKLRECELSEDKHISSHRLSSASDEFSTSHLESAEQIKITEQDKTQWEKRRLSQGEPGIQTKGNNRYASLRN